VESIKKIFRIDPRQIAYFRFILEAYDGLAVLTTLDAKSGVVLLYVPPACEEQADMIIRGLSMEMTIEPAIVEL
jgi:hypothetical protein